MQALVQSKQTQPRQEVDGSRIPELQNIVSDALACARKLGAAQAEADVSLQKGLTTTVRLGEVETVEYQRDRGMGVTVYFGKRKGSASTADLSARAVAETVEKACDIARYTAEDECAGLADPEELAREIPDLDLDHPWNLSPEQAVECARACEAAGRAVDARITNSEGATVAQSPGRARLWQLARIPGGLPVHQPQRELRAAGADRRRHATRLLVQHARAMRRPGSRRDHWSQGW